MPKGLKFRSSTLARSIRVLPRRDRPRIILVVVLQFGLSLVDLLGVAAVGVLGALSVTGIQSQEPGSRVSWVLETLRISNLDFQTQVAILGLTAATVFILRTFASIYITRKILHFLSKRGAEISSVLVRKLLQQPLLRVYERSTQETVYSLTAGVTAIVLSILGTSLAIVADASLLLVLLIGLFIVDPVVACSSLIFFGALGFSLYRSMNVKAHHLGYINSTLSIQVNEKIIEVLDTYRESVVRNRRAYYAREIGKLQLKLADTLAEIQFMPNVSKYVIESGMIVGAVLISGVQFALQDAKHAIAALSVFLAAGTRIAPAIMRLQQSLIQSKSGKGIAEPTLRLIESLQSTPDSNEIIETLSVEHKDFQPTIKIKQASIIYPGKNQYALDKINFSLSAGKIAAIVGPSGAGKTSLVDTLLGVLELSDGQVEISNVSPSDAVEKWPGAIAYVPQEVVIINSSIRENIALGFATIESVDELCWEALEIAQLDDYVKNLPEGLDTQVGEKGARLSGGQRQRLGIARAMFTKPKLLVLDEATSSLDGQTEVDLSGAISSLKGVVTVVMIAHRLSTVRNADTLLYLDKGKIVAEGSFEEVRALVPDFDRQAELMGL